MADLQTIERLRLTPTTEKFLEFIDCRSWNSGRALSSEEEKCCIHKLSLEVAVLFLNAWKRCKEWPDSLTAPGEANLLLDAFRGLRRELPLDEAGKRYGAAEAYEFIQGKHGLTHPELARLFPHTHNYSAWMHEDYPNG